MKITKEMEHIVESSRVVFTVEVADLIELLVTHVQALQEPDES